jgi:hypothetical protein
LSKAGKDILIKDVAQAIPTYAMSYFDLTKALCDKISKMTCRYWWSQQDDKHICHCIGWEEMMKSKQDAAMGFRDLHIFSTPMLERQSCRLQNHDSLCCTVLKAMYSPDTSILHAQAKPGISYTWQSILHRLELLKEGIIWCVGYEQTSDVFRDPLISSW